MLKIGIIPKIGKYKPLIKLFSGYLPNCSGGPKRTAAFFFMKCNAAACYLGRPHFCTSFTLNVFVRQFAAPNVAYAPPCEISPFS